MRALSAAQFPPAARAVSGADVDASARSRFFFTHRARSARALARERRGEARRRHRAGETPARHTLPRESRRARRTRACTGRWHARACGGAVFRATSASASARRRDHSRCARPRAMSTPAPSSVSASRVVARAKMVGKTAPEEVTAALGVDDVEDEDPGKNFFGDAAPGG